MVRRKGFKSAAQRKAVMAKIKQGVFVKGNVLKIVDRVPSDEKRPFVRRFHGDENPKKRFEIIFLTGSERFDKKRDRIIKNNKVIG